MTFVILFMYSAVEDLYHYKRYIKNKYYYYYYYRVILRKVGEVHISKHRLYISALEQARVLILGKYFLLKVINTIYKHCRP